MSVTIRLALTGRKNLPSYRMVVCNTRDKRNGRFLEVLGFYNPSMTPAQFDYDKEKYKSWVGKGALVSDAVKTLLTGKYSYTKYDPKGKKAGAVEETAAKPAEQAA
jgi:small subunit ribosomal protein S16